LRPVFGEEFDGQGVFNSRIGKSARCFEKDAQKYDRDENAQPEQKSQLTMSGKVKLDAQSAIHRSYAKYRLQDVCRQWMIRSLCAAISCADAFLVPPAYNLS